MKLLKYALLAIPFLYFSCDDDNDTPEPINEEEVITTMIVTLVNHQNGSDVVTMQTQDLDGDGPNAPVLTVSGPLNISLSTSFGIFLEIKSKCSFFQVFRKNNFFFYNIKRGSRHAKKRRKNHQKSMQNRRWKKLCKNEVK